MQTIVKYFLTLSLRFHFVGGKTCGKLIQASAELFKGKQEGFLFVAYTVAFTGFLDSFCVNPGVKAALCDVGQGGGVLFSQGGCEEPCGHHVDIVLLAADTGGEVENFRGEGIVQKVAHKHTCGKSDCIRLVGDYPAANHSHKCRFVLPESLWAKLVAGSPVVNVGEKVFNFFCGNVENSKL